MRCAICACDCSWWSRTHLASVKLDDPKVAAVVRRCQQLPGQDLFQYEGDDGQPHTLGSSDVNDYLAQISGNKNGERFTAKDFRTWHGTVIAAVALARADASATTPGKRKRAVSAAMKEVSLYLGNTPTVARASYVDPRLVDLFNDGVTIPAELAGRDRDLSDGVTHGKIEKAVLALLEAPKSEIRRIKRAAAA